MSPDIKEMEDLEGRCAPPSDDGQPVNYALQTIMAALYDSEINCTLSCFWDGGWDIALGDIHNGFVARGTFDHLWEVRDWLRASAVKHYPQSQFALMFNAVGKP